MKYLSYTLVVLAYLALIGYVVHVSNNPWWILMVLFIGALPTGKNDDDYDEEEEEQ